MKITIETADNGWIVSYDDPFDDRVNRDVLERRDDEERAEAFARLLWEITDLLGEFGSRYAACRISIGTTPGDKYAE